MRTVGLQWKQQVAWTRVSGELLSFFSFFFSFQPALTGLPWRCNKRATQTKWMGRRGDWKMPLCTHTHTHTHTLLYLETPSLILIFYSVWIRRAFIESLFEHPPGITSVLVVSIIHDGSPSNVHCVFKWIIRHEHLLFLFPPPVAGSRWTRLFIYLFIWKKKKKKKHSSTSRHFSSWGHFSTNIMPTIRGRESILSTWMFIFCRRKAIK